MLDSGASRSVSNNREDFAWISRKATVVIKGAGGKISRRGYLGTFKPNSLGIKEGVYFPTLSVERLISVRDLLQQGWKVVFEKSGSYVHKDGRSTKVDLSSSLPTVDLFAMPTIEAEKFEHDAASLCFISAMVRHRRSGHMWRPRGRKFVCPDCLCGKAKAGSHANRRPEKYKPWCPLADIATDFIGPITPQSIRSMDYAMIFICDLTSRVWAFPIGVKAACVTVAKSLITSLRATFGISDGAKVVRSLRSDNEPVLRSKSWGAMLLTEGVEERHSVPYNPQQNGK